MSLRFVSATGAAASLRRLYLSGSMWDASIQIGRDVLWWGPGSRGAFLLSDNAGPLEFFRLSVAWDRLRYTKLLVPLDDQGRFLYGMRLDWLVRDNLRVGLGEAVVGRGGIYGPYVLNPIPVLTDGLALWVRARGLGYDDNYGIAIDLDWIARPGTILYGELYLDDLTMPGNPFPWRTGATVGLFFAEPFRDGRTTLRLEHTRTTNWVYTTTDRASDYVRAGTVLGHWCAPDCELGSVAVTHRLNRTASLQVSYDLVRTGGGQLGQTWSGPDDAWARLYLSGVVETTQALRLTYAWAQAPALRQAVSVAWWTTANAGHVAGRTRQDWFLQWEIRAEF